MAEEQRDLGATHVIVDGIEGNMVRVELPDGSTEDWRLASLPRGVQEGDVIQINVEAGDVDMEIDHAQTHRRRNQAQTELLALNADAPDGDIDL